MNGSDFGSPLLATKCNCLSPVTERATTKLVSCYLDY